MIGFDSPAVRKPTRGTRRYPTSTGSESAIRSEPNKPECASHSSQDSIIGLHPIRNAPALPQRPADSGTQGGPQEPPGTETVGISPSRGAGLSMRFAEWLADTIKRFLPEEAEEKSPQDQRGRRDFDTDLGSDCNPPEKNHRMRSHECNELLGLPAEPSNTAASTTPRTRYVPRR